MKTLNKTLSSLSVGQPRSHLNLTLFPLLRPGAGAAGYVLLQAAVNAGTARIAEITEGGSVPQLLVDNQGDKPVLIMDGEELIGARQNRVANLTILVAAHSKTTIPVSCVEAGRWGYRSGGMDFNVSEHAQFSRGRAKRVAAVSRNLKSTGTYGGDQHEVWEEISLKACRMEVDAPTMAMADIYAQRQSDVSGYLNAFSATADQVGALFAIDGRIEGMDLFDAPDTFARMLPKLVQSFAIDAVETSSNGKSAGDAAEAAKFIASLNQAQTTEQPGIGLGTTLRLDAGNLVGGGLVYEEKLIHLAAFAAAGAANDPGGREQDAFDVRLASVRSRYRAMRNRRG